MIVGVVGLHGAGKGEVAEILSRKGFTALDMGDIIREEMHKAGIVITHETDQKFPVELRKQRGNDIVARLIMEKVRKLTAKDIVITGLRSTYELDYFRSQVPDMTLIAVEAPVETRYARLHSRGRPEDPKDMEQFNARLEREAKANMDSEEHRKAGLYAVIAKADFKIENTGTREDLLGEVERVLARIKKAKSQKGIN